MAQRDELSIFVRDALAAGKSRAEITSALTHAGWRSAEVQDALNGWDEMPFSPPIPRPVATVSARDFFTYALTFCVLILGAFNLVVVLQALVDVVFATGDGGSDRSIRWGVAVLIVTGPMYLWLTLRETGARPCALPLCDPQMDDLYRPAFGRADDVRGFDCHHLCAADR